MERQISAAEDRSDDDRAPQQIGQHTHALVVTQKPEARKHIVPVVDRIAPSAHGNERQGHGLGVLDIHRYIEQILADPEKRDCSGIKLAPQEEVDREGCGHEQLAQAAAHDHQVFAEPAEEHMACLVGHQIDAVKKAVFGHVEGKDDAVDRKQQGAGGFQGVCFIHCFVPCWSSVYSESASSLSSREQHLNAIYDDH